MGFFKRLFKREEEKKKFVMDPTTIPDGIFSNDTVDAMTASTISCVKRCIEVKCGAVASLGLHLFRRKSDGNHVWDVDYDAHPMDNILSFHPNHRQNAYNFLWDVIYQMEMNGDAYVIPVYRSGVLSELISLPEGGTASYAFQQPEGEIKRSVSYDRISGVYTVSDMYDGIYGDFDESEIIHLKSFSRDGFLGTPATDLARKILSIAIKTYRQQSDLFTPGSTLRGFITGDDGSTFGFGELQDDQLETVANRIRTELRKQSHLHYLPGSMKFVQTSMTPADLQLLESQKFINLEICRFFGVPPTQVFQDSNVNYKSSESSQSIFLTSTLVPLLRQIENEFSLKLLTPLQRRRMSIKFNLSDYYQSDPAVQYNALGNLVQRGVMTPNDARQRLGLCPVDGGDKLMIIGGKTNGESSGNAK